MESTIGGGWIKLDRKIVKHWIWKNPERLKAWLDLLVLAEYKTHKEMWRGKLTEFKRGDVCWSIEKLAERWDWSWKKVRRFLDQLEEDEMVQVNAHRNRTTITIIKYEFYQGGGVTDGTSERPSNSTTDGTSNDTTEDTSNDTSNDTYLKNINNSIKNTQEKTITAPPEDEDDDRPPEGEGWY